MSDHHHDHEHDHEHAHEHDDDDAGIDVEVEARRQLALAQIRQYGDPALRMQANEVAEVDDDVRRLVERMTSLMEDAQGVGLAATQVGVLRRIFVFVDGDEGPQAIVNPVFTERADESEPEEEGCLSLQGVKVPVERSVRVVLEGLDAAGAPVRHELEGYSARVVQHELDHLDGVLILDRTDDEHRKEALRVLRPRVVLR
ncbi:MAG TPA: peptide deformylase [Gaiellaceae bacterium]